MKISATSSWCQAVSVHAETRRPNTFAVANDFAHMHVLYFKCAAKLTTAHFSPSWHYTLQRWSISSTSNPQMVVPTVRFRYFKTLSARLSYFYRSFEHEAQVVSEL